MYLVMNGVMSIHFWDYNTSDICSWVDDIAYKSNAIQLQ